MEKILIISNRLPVTIIAEGNQIEIKPSTGGLATGLSSSLKNYNYHWLGWTGAHYSKKQNLQEKIKSKLEIHKMTPVFLTKHQLKAFYEGFSNSTLWPLFHYFPMYSTFVESQWEIYKQVNLQYCEEALKLADEDTFFWIHDYHLLLLPGMIREKFPKAKIGYFQHIPFPSFEILRILPWRKEILKGMMGADILGFHTYDDVKHFLTSVNRILGVDNKMGELRYEDRLVYTDAFPMGINFEMIEKAAASEETEILRNDYSKQWEGAKIILSIDRLDYSKGITEKLEAFQIFLECNPEYRNKVSLLLIVAPSRENVPRYKILKTEIDELVGNINGKYRTIHWNPVIYFYQSFSFNKLPALFKISDIALITPLRDGMNLVCKEYVTCRTNMNGVLILSEMAGASKELHEAIIINPYDINQTAEAIKLALLMPDDEQKRKMKDMQESLKRYNIDSWASLYLSKFKELHKKQTELSTKEFTPQVHEKLIKSFSSARKRKLFLDYDGTLVPLVSKPEFAKPDIELLNILDKISQAEDTSLVIITGRDKDTIGQWLQDLKHVDIIAEHGFWKKKAGEEWKNTTIASNEWKSKVKPLLELFVNRTPGSFIEEKTFSLGWHYRLSDIDLGEIRSRELIDLLYYFTGNMDLNVLEGKKIVEVKNTEVNKGVAALEWINEDDDFILSAGDDWTDEDMFKVMPERAYTLKIGFTSSVARFNILAGKNDPTLEMRKFLKALSDVTSGNNNN